MIVVVTLVGSVLLFEGDIPASTVDAKYSNSQSSFLILENGSRIHYRDQGQSAGFPIVLVHGAMASLHTWEPWVQVLGENYRLVTLDLPALPTDSQAKCQMKNTALMHSLPRLRQW